ncbi:MAG: FAD-dependent oxidoreductase, partial [Candidatus Sumerlaeia bacterium]|nr:FAD-dependent oxidoreductase [Candidatus Sumerlaeia bacterium]
ARTLELASGRTFDYDCLVLATGGRPRHSALLSRMVPEGRGFVLRSIEDADRILAGAGERVLIAGGGLLGVELADAPDGVLDVSLRDGLRRRPGRDRKTGRSERARRAAGEAPCDLFEKLIGHGRIAHAENDAEPRQGHLSARIENDRALPPERRQRLGAEVEPAAARDGADEGRGHGGTQYLGGEVPDLFGRGVVRGQREDRALGREVEKRERGRRPQETDEARLGTRHGHGPRDRHAVARERQGEVETRHLVEGQQRHPGHLRDLTERQRLQITEGPPVDAQPEERRVASRAVLAVEVIQEAGLQPLAQRPVVADDQQFVAEHHLLREDGAGERLHGLEERRGFARLRESRGPGHAPALARLRDVPGHHKRGLTFQQPRQRREVEIGIEAAKRPADRPARRLQQRLLPESPEQRVAEALAEGVEVQMRRGQRGLLSRHGSQSQRGERQRESAAQRHGSRIVAEGPWRGKAPGGLTASRGRHRRPRRCRWWGRMPAAAAPRRAARRRCCSRAGDSR